MQMTKRQKDILSLLNNQDYFTAQKLAKKLQVSEKTIRNDISQLNQAGREPMILSLKGKGYKLINNQAPAPSLILADTGELRQQAILLYFLSHPEPDFYELAELFYISESTLERDILTINQRLKKRFRHTEIKRKNSQFCLEGSEETIRGMFVYYLLRELKEYQFDFTCLSGGFNSCDITKVKMMVLDFLSEEKIILKDSELISLILYWGTALERVFEGYEIMGIFCEAGTEKSRELSQRLCDKMEEQFGISLPQSERSFLQSLMENGVDMQTAGKEREEEYQHFLKDVLTDIYNKYNIDLRENETFIENLLPHLVELHHRAKTRRFIENPLIGDIKDTYPLIYDISVYLGMRIQERFGIQMYEDEIGYISLHIVANMDSQSTEKKQIAIINPDGAAISRFIGDVLRRYFNNSIEIAGTYSLFQIDALRGQKPDLIITTVPMNQTFSCPVFQVSNLLNCQELETIKQLLASQELGKLEARLGLLYQFDNRLFFPLLQFTRREEVIRYLCRQLEKEGYCGSEYVDYVLEREAIASTSFGNYVAIPHPVEMAAYKNGIAVATLSNDVMWGDNKVRVVFLFSLASRSLNLTLFYDALAKSLNDTSKMKQIICHVEFNRFMDAFLS